jgi:hypothetical protein
MKMTRLVTFLFSLATLALFAADASAMYNPSTGTWLQRDPGPGGMMATTRVASGLANGVQFIPRDPSSTPLAAGVDRTLPAPQFIGKDSDANHVMSTDTRRVGFVDQILLRLAGLPFYPNTKLRAVTAREYDSYADSFDLYQYSDSNPINRLDPDGLFPVNVQYVGPATPGWNTPPGPACNAYITPPCCDKVLAFVCNNAGNGCWSNCVRGCLLADWNTTSCIYNSGTIKRHAVCFSYCDFKCNGGYVVWTGSGPCPSVPPP